MDKQEIKLVPKADLHVHLNGAVPTQIIVKQLLETKAQLPVGFKIPESLQVLTPKNSLVEYFDPWKAFKKLPIGLASLREMVNFTFKGFKEDNVNYVELRNSPFYISRLNGITLEESLLWLLDTIEEFSDKFDIDARLVLSLTRHEFDREEALQLLQAIKKVNYNKRIVGVDMSGDEDTDVPKEISVFFKRAKQDLGLGVTIHAGETGNIENVKWAVLECETDRIGHGLAAVQDSRVLELIKEKDICIETCLVSNIRTNSCGNIEDHPISKFIEYGVPFVLCTDNPAVHGLNLSEEYNIFMEIFKRPDILREMYKNQRKHSFRLRG